MFKTILVAIDGSAQAKRAAVVGTDLAKAYGSKLHFFMAVRPVPAKIPKEMRQYMEIEHILGVPEEVASDAALNVLEDAEKHARKKGVKSVKTAWEIGHPAREIMAYAKQNKAELIVIGRRGLGALEGMLLGSVSNKVVSLADCPVLTVH